MKSIAVFCGSSIGYDQNYIDCAFSLGQQLAKENIQVVYGGAQVGLMGALADGALQSGGRVVGVIPHFLSRKEIAHHGLTELIQVDSMHERKTRMNELSDGVIALPGGFGTMEEFFEMLTWGQLGLHQKPMGLLNINGFYDPLLLLVRQMHDQGFLKEIHLNMLLSDINHKDLLSRMKNYKGQTKAKWITTEET